MQRNLDPSLENRDHFRELPRFAVASSSLSNMKFLGLLIQFSHKEPRIHALNDAVLESSCVLELERSEQYVVRNHFGITRQRNHGELFQFDRLCIINLRQVCAVGLILGISAEGKDFQEVQPSLGVG